MGFTGERSLPPLRPTGLVGSLGRTPQNYDTEASKNYWTCLECHLYSSLSGNATDCRFDHAEKECYRHKIHKLIKLIIHRDRFCVMETPSSIKTELIALDQEFKRIKTIISNNKCEHSNIHQGGVLIPWEFPLWLRQLEQFLDRQICEFSDEANLRSVGDDKTSPLNFPWIHMRLVEFKRKMQTAMPQFEIVFRPNL